MRVVETHGRNSTAELTLSDRAAKLIPTNLMEWDDGEAVSGGDSVVIKLKPFEILTFKIKG